MGDTATNGWQWRSHLRYKYNEAIYDPVTYHVNSAMTADAIIAALQKEETNKKRDKQKDPENEDFLNISTNILLFSLMSLKPDGDSKLQEEELTIKGALQPHVFPSGSKVFPQTFTFDKTYIINNNAALFGACPATVANLLKRYEDSTPRTINTERLERSLKTVLRIPPVRQGVDTTDRKQLQRLADRVNTFIIAASEVEQISPNALENFAPSTEFREHWKETKKVTDAISKCAGHLMHSEMLLITYLESIPEEEIEFFIEKAKGGAVVLNIHSRFDICNICSSAIAVYRAQGFLPKKLAEHHIPFAILCSSHEQFRDRRRENNYNDKEIVEHNDPIPFWIIPPDLLIKQRAASTTSASSGASQDQ